jgi:hypothetical protein
MEERESFFSESVARLIPGLSCNICFFLPLKNVPVKVMPVEVNVK